MWIFGRISIIFRFGVFEVMHWYALQTRVAQFLLYQLQNSVNWLKVKVKNGRSDFTTKRRFTTQKRLWFPAAIITILTKPGVFQHGDG